MVHRPVAASAAFVALCLVAGLAPAQAAEQPTPSAGPARRSDMTIAHPDRSKLTSVVDRAVGHVAPQSGPVGAAAAIGDEKLWAAVDFVAGFEYLKAYTLRGVGEHIEVWVASDSDELSSDLDFLAGDCRNDERVEITDEQVQYLIDEYDDVILPSLSSAFSVAPDRDGSGALLPVLLPELGLPADYYTGEGDNVVVLVDNVRDPNFYDLSLANENVTYVAGFFTSSFNEYFDRNVMTIDGYDWLHRTGANPPDEPVPGDLCASKPARPFSYESTFAHEYQHLLEYYEDPDETSWINEGLSMYAEEVAGYADPTTPITEVGYDVYIQCLLGNSEISTPANPNPRRGGPENSLTVWGDQGDGDEILCDYGAGFAFMLYAQGRFGPRFLSDLHRDDRNGLESVEGLLAEYGTGVTARDLVHRWAAMLALDAALEEPVPFFGGFRPAFSTPGLNAAINWDNDDAYATPGAPPNGADFVRLRGRDGRWLTAAEVGLLFFDGDEVLPTTPVEWTVVADPPGQAGDPALWSGSGGNFDRSMVATVTVPATDPTLRFETSYEIEALWDFGFVQVSTDGGETWTSLANANTTTEHDPGAIPAVAANVPGFTGSSGGWVEQVFDLSAYAGQEILLSFRYITDPNVDPPGWYVDDITVGGELVSDGTSLAPFRSASEVNPTEIAGYSVQLIGYSSTGSAPAFSIPLRPGPRNNAIWFGPRDLPRHVLERIDVVAAIVMYDEPTELVTDYAPYTLYVNGVAQPGGRAPAV